MGLGTEIYKLMNRGHVWMYRRSRGRLGTMRHRVLLLTTRGARSGKEHTVPLMGTPHGDGWVVAASAGGAPRNPAWYHNLLASPDVTVEKDARKTRMRARVAGPGERADLWAEIVAFDRRFSGYETKTNREIPIVLLEPPE